MRELISWEVDFVRMDLSRVDFVGVDHMKIDLVARPHLVNATGKKRPFQYIHQGVDDFWELSVAQSREWHQNNLVLPLDT